MNKYTFFIFMMVLTASVKGQGVSISQLPPVTGSYHGSLDTTALLPVVQDSVPGKKKTYKASIANIKSLLGSTATSGNAWVLGGNDGVNPDTVFICIIGTDTLQFQINGVRSGLLDNGLKKNTSWGAKALNGFYPGNDNTAVGADALSYASGGSTGIGSGSGNTALGSGAAYSLINGSYNTTIGYHSNVCSSGNGVTSIGANASVSDSGIAIGLDASICVNRVFALSPHIDSVYFPLSTGNTGYVLSLGIDNGYGQKFASWHPTSFTPSDSLTIYSLTPSNFTAYACTDCTGNGITGAILTFIDGLWRRLKFD